MMTCNEIAILKLNDEHWYIEVTANLLTTLAVHTHNPLFPTIQRDEEEVNPASQLKNSTIFMSSVSIISRFLQQSSSWFLARIYRLLLLQTGHTFFTFAINHNCIFFNVNSTFDLVRILTQIIDQNRCHKRDISRTI